MSFMHAVKPTSHNFYFSWTVALKFGIRTYSYSDVYTSEFISCKLVSFLSEVNQVTIMWVPGYSGIQQNETTIYLT